jgi:hypothetical protein
VADAEPSRADSEAGLDRLVSVAVLVGIVAAVIAGATIWLLLSDPVTVASAIDEGEISPLVRQLANVLYEAIVSLLNYL